MAETHPLPPVDTRALRSLRKRVRALRDDLVRPDSLKDDREAYLIDVGRADALHAVLGLIDARLEEGTTEDGR